MISNKHVNSMIVERAITKRNRTTYNPTKKNFYPSKGAMCRRGVYKQNKKKSGRVSSNFIWSCNLRYRFAFGWMSYTTTTKKKWMSERISKRAVSAKKPSEYMSPHFSMSLVLAYETLYILYSCFWFCLSVSLRNGHIND